MRSPRINEGKLRPITRSGRLNSQLFARTGVVGGASPDQRQKRLGSYTEAFYFPPYVAEVAPPAGASMDARWPGRAFRFECIINLPNLNRRT